MMPTPRMGSGPYQPQGPGVPGQQYSTGPAGQGYGVPAGQYGAPFPPYPGGPTSQYPYPVPRQQAPNRARRMWRRVLWWAGAVLIGAAYALTGLQSQTGRVVLRPIMVGQRMITAESLLAVTAGVGVVCWVACFVLWVAARLVHESLGPHRGYQILASITAGVVSAAVLAVTGLMALAAVALGGPGASTSHVLYPPSPAGCQLVVRQFNGFTSDNVGWTVYVQNPGSIWLVDAQAGWNMPGENNTYDPIEHGTWSLSWDAEQANLQVWMDQGGQTQPLTLEQDHPITCPA